jgi:hypothetical protein
MAERDRMYIAVLKGKQGELGALAELDDVGRAGLTPLLEVMESTGTGSRTAAQEGAALARKLERAWPSTDPIWVDMARLDPASRGPVLSQAAKDASSLQIVPVVDLSPAGTHVAVARRLGEKVGLVLRLPIAIAQSPTLKTDIDGLLASAGVTPGHVDLVLDLGAVLDQLAGAVSLGAVATINALPHLSRWRSLTLASSSFPQSLTGRGVSTVPRTDWQLWRTVDSNATLNRRPRFADYAIQHPEIPQLDFRFIRMSPSIRYTAADYWVIARGTPGRGNENNRQYPTLAQQIVARPEYSGADFSWGDGYLMQCSQNQGSPGTATVWRKVGTSHHLAFVPHQLASLH